MDTWPTPRLIWLQHLSRYFLLVALVACGTHAPVVANPPENLSEANLDEPWITDERAMMRDPSADLSGVDPHSDEEFNGPFDNPPQRGVMDMFADVLAFPFRGIGWLFQTLF